MDTPSPTDSSPDSNHTHDSNLTDESSTCFDTPGWMTMIAADVNQSDVANVSMIA